MRDLSETSMPPARVCLTAVSALLALFSGCYDVTLASRGDAGAGATDSDGSSVLVLEWINLPGGSYAMGDGTGAASPVHQVTVQSFQMLKTEVMVEQYRWCVHSGPCTPPTSSCNYDADDRKNFPMNCVVWEAARDFCTWIGARLPSEAEWEYAARSGGEDLAYPWGNETATCQLAVMYGTNYGCGEDRTWETCSHADGNSAQGLCDLAGNVSEWVADCWHLSYSGAPVDGSAWTGDEACSRVVRGGSFRDFAPKLLATERNYVASNNKNDWTGFRCVK